MWTLHSFRAAGAPIERAAPSGLQHNRARPGPADPDLLAPVEVVLIPARAIGTQNPDQSAVGEKDVVDGDVAEIGDFLDLPPGDIVRRAAFEIGRASCRERGEI